MIKIGWKRKSRASYHPSTDKYASMLKNSIVIVFVGSSCDLRAAVVNYYMIRSGKKKLFYNSTTAFVAVFN